ncbi:MAG TPA: Bax inhibitor-1/YccA family protein [Phycisphaerales bacterium]
MNSSNPAFKAFDRPIDAPNWADLASAPSAAATPGAMTVRGTAIKSGVLLAIVIASAVGSWFKFEPMVQAGQAGAIVPWALGSMALGLVLSLVIGFVPKTAAYLAPVYAAAEGIFLAAASLFISLRFLKGVDTGLIFQAMTLTFGIAGATFIAYASGLVRIGGMVGRILMVALTGVMIYAVALLLCNGVFNMNLPNLWSSASPWGIAFSGFVVLLASFTLVQDYQIIEESAQSGAPKYMEWYGAFALTVTLVWLYIEVLRLLAKLRSKD